MNSVASFFKTEDGKNAPQPPLLGGGSTMDNGNSESSHSRDLKEKRNSSGSLNRSFIVSGMSPLESSGTGAAGRSWSARMSQGTGSTGVDGQRSSSSSSPSLQQMMTDTLVEKIIKMALPPSSSFAKGTIAERMAYAKNRPSLSVPLMSRNFIQMNSRMGIPFMLIDKIITLCNWENVPMTLCILCMYTYLVLKPVVVISCGPIFYLLFGIMVPQYLHIHLPNPVADRLVDVNRTPAQGPPLRKPILPDPVPELSQEFVLNLTDLQNHILLYVVAYDCVCFVLKRFAFFINEQISALSFVVLLGIALFNFLFIESLWVLIPIRLILIVVGWGAMIMLYPSNREYLLEKLFSEETRLYWLDMTRDYEHKINEQLRFVEAREQKMVIVYEIQVYKDAHKEWTTVGFSPDDYTLFSKLRISEQEIEENCSKTLDGVEPPRDWEWLPGSSWILDLDAKEWVEENFVQYVKIDLRTKWVYDVDIGGSMGKYRRRMWTNMVRRKMKGDSNNNGNATFDENSTPSECEKDGHTSRRSSSTGVLDGRVKDASVHGKYDTGEYSMDSSREGIEEVVNPLREDLYSEGKMHGIARRSMSGTVTLPRVKESTTTSHPSHADIIEETKDGLVDVDADLTNILNTSM